MYLTALFAPFLGSALAGLMGRWIGARGSGIVTITGLFTRMTFSYFIFYEVLILGSPVVISLGSWFGAHSINIDWLLSFDA
jgi:NADH-quinone oxidoreductase subunit L